MKTLPVRFENDELHKDFKVRSTILGVSMNEFIIKLVQASASLSDADIIKLLDMDNEELKNSIRLKE
jgi:hypothetical protein